MKMNRPSYSTPDMEGPLMFENTSILGISGTYRTTAELIDSVIDRMEPDDAPMRHSRHRRFEPMNRASTRRARARKQMMRRHRRAS